MFTEMASQPATLEASVCADAFGCLLAMYANRPTQNKRIVSQCCKAKILGYDFLRTGGPTTGFTTEPNARNPNFTTLYAN